ncbi:MAG TPA: hypothetical protein VK188_05435 [Holophaga sp.]|nr:hypothetical protein [Holophaga sp.]
MRPTFLLPFALPALLAAAPQAPAGDDLARRLTSYHTRLFAVGDLVTTPFDAKADEVTQWTDLMNEFTRAVQAGGTKEQGKDMEALANLSHSILQERNRASQFFKSRFPDGKVPSGTKFPRKDLKDLIDGDATLRNKAKPVDAILDRASKSMKDPADAGDLLYRLSLTLLLTVDAYHNHLLALVKR